VGDVRGAAVPVARETSPAAQEVHQDRCSVSLHALYLIITTIILPFLTETDYSCLLKK